MANSIAPLLPATRALLAALGERLQLARRRRQLTATQVAERAGMTRVTLRAVENGSAGATIGAYLAVLQVLGLEGDLAKLAEIDPLGRQLQDAALLPSRLRTVKPKQAKSVSSPPGAAHKPKATRQTRAGAQPHSGTTPTPISAIENRAAALASLILKRPGNHDTPRNKS